MSNVIPFRQRAPSPHGVTAFPVLGGAVCLTFEGDGEPFEVYISAGDAERLCGEIADAVDLATGVLGG